jgi:Ras family
VYDSTSESTFAALDGWFDLLKKTNSGRCPPSILISTKNDYPAMRAVSPDQGQSFAKKIDAKFFQINSLNYQEVEPALNSLTDLK